MQKRYLSIILILIGILLITCPKVQEIYRLQQQQKMEKEWKAELAQLEKVEEEEAATGQNEEELEVEGVETEREKARQAYLEKHMEGMLTIKKIDFSQPILKEATKENLNISVSSVKGTSKPGQGGNYALAAHRSKTYGRHFNRLEELQNGDEIEVDTGSSIYRYTVSEKLYVKPEDTWVLNSREDTEEITLITCHPMVNPTQRLIIKGSLSEERNR